MPITDCITAFVCHVDEQMQALPEHPVVMVGTHPAVHPRGCESRWR